MSLVKDAPAPVLLRPADWWFTWRNRLIRSGRFQRFVASFPLTRPVARRRAGELFDLVAGFVYSQVLACVIRLDVLDLVADRPLSVEQIAERTRLPPEAARRLCAAAAVLRLLSDRGGGRMGLGDLGAALLAHPGLGAMVRHHALFYEDLRDPVALLRGETSPTMLSRFWAYATETEPAQLSTERVADYSRLMAVSQDFIASEVLDAYPLDRHSVLLDVGGGEGAFARAAAQRTPSLSVILFDLPAVASRAAQAFDAAGLSSRARAVGGSMFEDPLPAGADVATLVRVLYDHPAEKGMALLRALHAALPDGGVLLVAEPMSGTPGAEAMGAVYFSLYLLAMNGGECRSASEIVDMLRQAGFGEAVPVRTRQPLFTSLVMARR